MFPEGWKFVPELELVLSAVSEYRMILGTGILSRRGSGPDPAGQESGSEEDRG